MERSDFLTHFEMTGWESLLRRESLNKRPGASPPRGKMAEDEMLSDLPPLDRPMERSDLPSLPTNDEVRERMMNYLELQMEPSENPETRRLIRTHYLAFIANILAKPDVVQCPHCDSLCVVPQEDTVCITRQGEKYVKIQCDQCDHNSCVWI